MKAQDILGVKVKYNHEVAGIKCDSRQVRKNDIFVAIKGNKNDGFDFINEAIENKAKTIVSDDERINQFNSLDYRVNFIYVRSSIKELSFYLQRFYSDISKDLYLIGVTGTNGKTTTTTLLYKYFRYLGKNVTLIGTNGVYINDDYYETQNTTPSLLDIYGYLKLSLEKQSKIIIMEVSSQGIKECRVKGLHFKIGLLTNITLDHLDYHHSFCDYYYTKLSFLNSCEQVICNSDTIHFLDIYKALNQSVITYGHNNSDYTISNEHLDIIESSFDLKLKEDNNKEYSKYYIMTSLLGKFNIENVCAFIAIVDTMGIFNQYTLSYLKKKITIDGRFEIIKTSKCHFVIDFAHTPDGIQKILEFMNTVKNGKIITVIGMGGDRDKTKRPIVGKICTELSDSVIFTADNSRGENTQDIIRDIIKGIDDKNKGKFIIEPDRRKAIEFSHKFARTGDIILILGKGNENYQIEGNKRLHFSDREEVLKILNKSGD